MRFVFFDAMGCGQSLKVSDELEGEKAFKASSESAQCSSVSTTDGSASVSTSSEKNARQRSPRWRSFFARTERNGDYTRADNVSFY